MLTENPFFILAALLALGFALVKFGVFDRILSNQGNFEKWFAASRLRTFGIPLVSAVFLCVAFYLFGGIAIITQAFAYAFVFFIFANFVMGISGRHKFRLGVSLAFLFVFFGSITSLILFNLG